MTSFQQNCSLLIYENTRKAAIVDPGGDSQLIHEALTLNWVIPEKILLTHGHLDHVGAAGELAESLAIPIIGSHNDDQFWLSALSDQARAFGFPVTRTFLPDRWLKQGDEISVGNETLEVRHCPGHTPGHVIFFIGLPC